MSAESNRKLGDAQRARIRDRMSRPPYLSQTALAKDLGIARNTLLKHLDIIKLEDAICQSSSSTTHRKKRPAS